VLEAPTVLKNILVVEDTRIHRELVERWLGNEYAVTVAADRESAELRLHRGPSFDLVILDSKIPEKDGSETSRDESVSFLETFRKQSNAPVIMVVSHPIDAPLREEAAKYKVIDILEKPFVFEELQSSLKRLFTDKPLPHTSDR
jgi:CheY-like chemotaxis protein